MENSLTSVARDVNEAAAVRAGSGQTNGTSTARDTPVLRPLWEARYRIALVSLDVCCIVVATVVGFELRFGPESAKQTAVSYLGIGAILAICWAVALQAVGGYEIRHLATGPEEAKRVLRASAITVSVLAIYCYATKTQLARGYVVGVVPVGIALLLAERTLARRFVRRRRDSGRWVHRILAVGTSESVRHLLAVTERARGSGLKIVGACVEDGTVGEELARNVPVMGGVRQAASAAADAYADVVAVTGSGLGPVGVRELGWQLAGTGRGLVLAPSLTEIAGTRVRVSPVEGLPLVWLEQPQLGRLPCIAKRALDLIVGSVMLVLATPLLVATAVAIKVSSRGPILFRQLRLGANGTEFSIVKFRSMHADAESRRADYIGLDEQDGAGMLFKIRGDPRITTVGHWIRKFSIDELPQLVNVISGKMSLVGPRPLPTTDSTYTGSARRRLLVRPGLTGLWQVSGRSELSWDDAVRLDLYYVENWSLGLDIGILMRTISAVVARKGAF